MAAARTQKTTSDCIISQQDNDDSQTDYKYAYETYVTTIPRDGSLTKEECFQRHEALSKEFRDRLIEAANKSSNLQILVSFVHTIVKDETTDEICSVEQDLETKVKLIHQINEGDETNNVPQSVLSSLTATDISNTFDEYDDIPKDENTENAHYAYNIMIMEKDIEWLSVPFLAVERHNLEVLEMCIKTGMQLEIFRNLKDQTLLGHAMEQFRFNFDIIKSLLKCIGVNIGTKCGITPIMSCIINTETSVKDRFALLKLLIDAGADVMIKSDQIGTALHAFIFSLLTEMDVTKLTDWKSVIDLLLTEGVDINATDFLGQSALMSAIMNVPPTRLEDSDEYDLETKSNIIAVRKCKIEIIEYLLHKGAHIDVVANNGYTALCKALANENVDVVETLVKLGANVNHLTNLKMSPAQIVCSESDWSDEDDVESVLLPLLRVLLNAGLNINNKGIDDSTVLHFAAAQLNHNICEFLIKSGADIEANDYLQRKPLHMAIRNTNIMVIKTLIMLGADIEAKDIHGDTPLTHACLWDNTKAVQILIDNGADFMACGDLGIQPIHLAAENGNSLMMEILQKMGCDLSTPDASGSTPLHYAASNGNPDTVQYLLSQNANKMCKDYQGLVPLDLARLRGHYRVSTLLADCLSTVKFGRLPPGLFPNRPLRKMNELDAYIEEITEPLKSIGEPGICIGKAILDTPGLGRLNLDEGESNQICKCIHHLCLEIVERIGELDPLFQCKLMNAGSCAEGVKIGYPDEFDFVCHMEKINAFVERVENVDIPEYCQIIMKDSLPPDISRFCLHSNKILNADAIFRHFCKLISIARHDVLKRKHQNIYSGLTLLIECRSYFEDDVFGFTTLQGFNVSWRGQTYKHIDVSIDINPVLYTNDWPTKPIISSILLPNIREIGMYLIPKPRMKYFPEGGFGTHHSDLWRYSTHHVEALMMQMLPQEAKDCYMLCKAFRLEPLMCSIEVNKTESLMYKRVLTKLSPLDQQRKGDDEVYNENDNVDDDDDVDIKLKCMRNEADNEFWTEYGNGDIVKCDDDRDLNRGEQEVCVLTIPDSNILIHNYDGTGKVMMEYDDDDDEGTYEVTAEQCIPSYHLKSLFLREAEDILSKSGTFSDRELQTIPYTVYERLKTAVDDEYLTTIFFPGQNIYRQPNDNENLAASIQLRISFIKAILRLMKELGFGFDV